MAFDNCLGLCTLESERLVFPLTGRYAREFAAHRLALARRCGAYHSSAGRAGRQPGFMDAAELIEELRRLHREGKISASISIFVATSAAANTARR